MHDDGLFETMLIEKGKILLKELHFDRLLRGMKLLGISSGDLTPAKLEEEIKLACVENNCTALARVRLTVYKGSSYQVKTAPLDPGFRNNKKGLVTDIYPEARKSIDEFSNLKSTNYSIFINAASYAKEKELEDCLVLNTKENICESSISNVFIVKDNEILTPSLSEGCIEGVMRKWVISFLEKRGQPVKETAISLKALETADEIFLTNAIRGIRWVKQFKDCQYNNAFSSTIIQ